MSVDIKTLSHKALILAFEKMEFECERAKKGRKLAVDTANRKNMKIILKSAQIRAKEYNEKIRQENAQLKEELAKLRMAKLRQFHKFQTVIANLKGK